MTAPVFLLVASCLGAAMLAPVLAFAGEGRISFSGRIVEPTCETSEAAITHFGIGRLPHRMACGLAGSAAPSRGYVLSVTRLGSDAPDRVLRYFATYVRAADPSDAHPVLLTKVYD